MDRILSTEFGLDRPSDPARTPERGRAWLSGWLFDAPFESIPREEVRNFLSWAYFNREGMVYVLLMYVSHSGQGHLSRL